MSSHNASRSLTILDILAAKGQRRLAMLTAYDAPFARLVEGSGADMILVGDSVAMTLLGRPDTNSVTMEEMLHHCRAVTGAVSRPLVVADMPFLSYEDGPSQALANAGRFFREGGARAVKMEGGADIAPQISALTRAGIPVMGHLGLTPQRAATLGGFKAQARDAEGALRLKADALALEEAGCFALVLECVPPKVAAWISAALRIPTIGIGAGAGCDGQVLVIYDMLGLFGHKGQAPRFVKPYADLDAVVGAALGAYVQDVENGSFPGPEHVFTMKEEEEKRLHALDADFPA